MSRDVTAGGCSHLSEWAQRHGGFGSLSTVVQYVLSATGSHRSVPILRCMRCRCASGTLLSCVDCFHFGCSPVSVVPSSRQRHATDHMEATGHAITVDTQRLELFCLKCGDYVYSRDAEVAMLSAHLFPVSSGAATARAVTAHEEELLQLHSAPAGPELGRPYSGLLGLLNLGNTCFMSVILQSLLHNPLLRNYFLADMHNRDSCRVGRLDVLAGGGAGATASGNVNGGFGFGGGAGAGGSAGAAAVAAHVGVAAAAGLNGTASAVSAAAGDAPALQSLGGTAPSPPPPLGNVPGLRSPRLCLGCDLDDLFQHAYTGDTNPHVPHQFLHSMWAHADHLAGYVQQDAHEFYISLLDGLHSACGGAARDCRCVVHRVFGGRLRSEVTCTLCGSTSSAYDPFVDVSLDLRLARYAVSVPVAAGVAAPVDGTDGTDAADGADSSGVGAGAAARPAASAAALADSAGAAGAKPESPAKRMKMAPRASTYTLLGCLDRFTHPETLHHMERFRCGNCNQAGETTKQLSFDVLPRVLTLHLKRFDRSLRSTSKNGKAVMTSTKIGTFVGFPAVLDMAPFTSRSIVAAAAAARAGAASTPAAAAVASAPASSGPSSSKSPPLTGSTLVSVMSPGTPSRRIPRELYDLFAVVVHIGSLDHGHYVNYVRQGHSWFKCDDDVITPVAREVVLESQAYLLYYLKRDVARGTGTTPLRAFTPSGMPRTAPGTPVPPPVGPVPPRSSASSVSI